MVNEERNLPWVFDTSEANQALATYAQFQKDNRKFSIGWPDEFPTLKNRAPNIFPGQAWVVQACPGEGKSAWAAWWSKTVQEIAAAHSTDKIKYGHLSCVLEESIELVRSRTMSVPLDFKSISAGEADMAHVLKCMAQSADDPMYYIGPSMSGGIISVDAANFNGIKPREIGMASMLLSDQNVNLIGCVVDYIQLMTDNNDSQEWQRRVANSSREMMQVIRNTMKCPVMICAQSDLKKVKERAGNKTPGLADIQWSSQIAQDADIVWSFWKPSNDVEPDKAITIKGKKISPFRDIIVVKIDKWRNTDMAGETFVMCLGKPFGKLFEVDLDQVNSICASKENRESLCSQGIFKLTDIPASYY